MGQNFYDVGNPLLIWKKTDKPPKQIWAKPQDREGAPEAKSLSQAATKDLVNVIRKQIWFDRLAAGIPPEKTDQQPHAMLESLKA